MPVLWQGRERTETGPLPLPLAPGRDEGSSPVLGVFSGMNKFFFAALALLPLAAAAQNPTTVLTPEKLWRLGRLGEMQVSPDGKTVAYTVTRYNLAENRGNADIFTVPVAGGAAKRLTDTPSSENTLNWRSDGKLTFLEHFRG